MARFWENNGQPLNDGRFCYVIDPEDGTHPLRMYGATKEEALEKATKSLEHGQRLITQLRTQPRAAASSAPPAVPEQPARNTRLTPDEIMTAAADISNPAKAADAVTKLVQHATGVDLKAQAARDAEIRMANLAEQWQASHPEIEASTRAEKRLLLVTAIQIAGDIGKVTTASLDAAWSSMVQQGYFSGEPEDEAESFAPVNPHAPTPTSASAGNGVPRTTVRPRGATTVRSSSLRATAPSAPRNTAKYTRAQVDAMDADTLAEKLRTEPGFADLVGQYERTSRRASA